MSFGDGEEQTTTSSTAVKDKNADKKKFPSCFRGFMVEVFLLIKYIERAHSVYTCDCVTHTVAHTTLYHSRVSALEL